MVSWPRWMSLFAKNVRIQFTRQCSALNSVVQCSELHFTAPHCTALHCTALFRFRRVRSKHLLISSYRGSNPSWPCTLWAIVWPSYLQKTLYLTQLHWTQLHCTALQLLCTDTKSKVQCQDCNWKPLYPFVSCWHRASFLTSSTVLHTMWEGRT